MGKATEASARPPGRPREPNLPYHHQNPDDTISSADYVLLPSYHRHRHRHRPPCSSFRILRRISYAVISISLLGLAVFLLWPSDPEIQIVRLHLDRVRIVPNKSLVSLDIALDITIRVRNRDFFSLRYRSLIVSINYRGRQLGFVTSDGGSVRGRGSSYVDATLQLDGIQVLHDVFYLLEDLARGSIPFDTVTDFDGQIRLFFLDVPLKARVSCEVYVNTNNQTVIRQDCYPE